MRNQSGARFHFKFHKINVLSGFQIDRHDFGQLGVMSHPSLISTPPASALWRLRVLRALPKIANVLSLFLFKNQVLFCC